MSEILHIYAQRTQHEDAYIVGDKRSLMALRDAISYAIDKNNTANLVGVYTNDGEGYCVKIVICPEKASEQLSSPYTDRNTLGPEPKDVIRPWDLFKCP